MRVHHLNLCTMCPFGGRHISGGAASVFSPGEMVCHALVVETDDGLVVTLAQRDALFSAHSPQEFEARRAH